jgi:ketosteroid isomerase-like protein
MSPFLEDVMSQAALSNFLDRFPHAFQEGDPLATQKQMEAANVRRLQELYQGIARGDFQSFNDALAEDSELEIVGGLGIPFNGRWRGRDAVVQAARENFSQIEDARPVILSIVAQGDDVVLSCREQGRFRSTKQPYDVHWVLHVKFRDGQITNALEVCAVKS